VDGYFSSLHTKNTKERRITMKKTKHTKEDYKPTNEHEAEHEFSEELSDGGERNEIITIQQNN
jgi:hypothetical protein